jgi:hypothetical protein
MKRLQTRNLNKIITNVVPFHLTVNYTITRNMHGNKISWMIRFSYAYITSCTHCCQHFLKLIRMTVQAKQYYDKVGKKLFTNTGNKGWAVQFNCEFDKKLFRYKPPVKIWDQIMIRIMKRFHISTNILQMPNDFLLIITIFSMQTIYTSHFLCIRVTEMTAIIKQVH